MKIFRASMSTQSAPQNGLFVSLPGGFLSLDEVQLAGKKRMPTADMLRGTTLSIVI